MEPCTLAIISAGAVFFPSVFKLTLTAIQWLSPSVDHVKQLDISIKIVCTIQALLAMAVGLMTIENTKDEIVYSRYPLLEHYTIFVSAYFYYDTWAMYVVYCAEPANMADTQSFLRRVTGFVRKHPLMIAHHMVIPVTYGPAIVLWRDGKGDYLIGSSMLMEATIPFVSARFIMLQLGLKETVLYLVNGVFLAVSFLLARIGIWFYMIDVYAKYKGVSFMESWYLLPRICQCGTLGLLSMNTYWLLKILYVLFKTFYRRFTTSSHHGFIDVKDKTI